MARLEIVVPANDSSYEDPINKRVTAYADMFKAELEALGGAAVDADALEGMYRHKISAAYRKVRDKLEAEHKMAIEDAEMEEDRLLKRFVSVIAPLRHGIIVS